MLSLPPILSFITFSPIFFVSIVILRFWTDPLKQHDNAMNECFADQPLQPQQRRINLWNPLQRRGYDEAMNGVMNECFAGAKILRFVWWWFGCERERVVLGFGFQCFQRVCERKMARERIIKNGKRMNILLNKCVE